MSDISKETKILIRRDAKLIEDGLKKCKNQIVYIEDETQISATSDVKNDVELKSKDKKEKEEETEKETNKCKESYDKRIEKLEEENSTLKNYVSYLSFHLSKSFK